MEHYLKQYIYIVLSFKMLVHITSKSLKPYFKINGAIARFILVTERHSHKHFDSYERLYTQCILPTNT